MKKTKTFAESLSKTKRETLEEERQKNAILFNTYAGVFSDNSIQGHEERIAQLRQETISMYKSKEAEELRIMGNKLETMEGKLEHVRPNAPAQSIYRHAKQIRNLKDQHWEWPYFKKVKQGGLLQHPDCLYELGMCFFEGRGTDANIAKAVRYIIKAAQLEHVLAMYNTAIFYESGKGVQADQERSIYWFNRAAQAGHLDAMEKLVGLYTYSPRFQDLDEAKKWALRHANSGGSPLPSQLVPWNGSQSE